MRHIAHSETANVYVIETKYKEIMAKDFSK